MKTVFAAALAGLAGFGLVQSITVAEAATFKETVLHSFCSQRHCKDGAQPYSSLIATDGLLYGTTTEGGGKECFGHGCGVVFSIDPNTGVEKVLYAFCSKTGCTDGYDPHGGLIKVGRLLYGTAAGGTGKSDECESCGVVFSLNPKTGTERVVYSFCKDANCTDGAAPTLGLTYVNGMLYGATQGGGANDGGTVFALDPKTGAEKVVYSFCSVGRCADGYIPNGDLIAVNGALYGTTAEGGRVSQNCSADGCGAVFSVDLNTGAESVVYTFCQLLNCADGASPWAGLTESNGKLYGTTLDGGVTGCMDRGCGIAFSVDLDTGKEQVVYAFCQQQFCPDGALPEAGLIDVDGTLYGTTAYGGRTGCPQSGDCGTVFSIDPGTGAEAVLYAFCGQKKCKDGWGPKAGLIGVNGTLYGMTSAGGASNHGVVFTLAKQR